jgi:RimJ/RimL family protein N-acetyltransferase
MDVRRAQGSGVRVAARRSKVGWAMVDAAPWLSVANETDLVLYGLRGLVLRREGYIVVQTPDEPTSRLGNQLIFKDSGAVPDVGRWMSRFQDEFGECPGIDHVTLNYQGTTRSQDLEAAVAEHGLDVSERSVLTCPIPNVEERGADGLAIGMVGSDVEWDHLALLATRGDGGTQPVAHPFFQRHFAMQRELVQRRRAFWLVGRADGRIVSSMGLRFTEHGLGRFQAVHTLSPYRNRGFGGAMLSRASRIARDEFDARTLALVTDDAHQDALRLYHALGFRVVGRQVLLVRW